jgi:threonine dehydrogenase-like Zn-dependent dehydrogenase
MNTKSLAEALIQVATSDALPPDDDIEVNNNLEILIKDQWVSVQIDVWRAWSGLRTIWGHEYHGPVYALGTPTDTPWTGARVCMCTTCQTHVEPKYRPN